MQGSNLPLTGIRVVDIADEKGELCGRLLADLGADVIHVEPPTGSSSRRLPPLAPDGRESLYFAYRNYNKRGVTLDVTRPSGQALLHRLLARADILIETFAPGYLASIGLDPSSLLEQYPSLIITSITDFGQTGPYREFVGTDMVGFAMGGMMYRAGLPDKPPLAAPGALAYDSASVTATFATLTAYFQRLQTGCGQHLDVSVMESVANMADWSLPSYSKTGAYNRRAGAGIYPIYPCADGHVRMVLLSRRQWRALKEWLGEPDVLQGEMWEQLMYRVANRDLLDPLIVELFQDMTKVEIAREAQERGIPITPVLTPSEVLNNEHTAARGTFINGEVLPGVEGSIAAGFFHMDGHRLGYRRRAPLLGEHNFDVYVNDLGLNRDDLVTLRAEGVI